MTHESQGLKRQLSDKINRHNPNLASKQGNAVYKRGELLKRQSTAVEQKR